MSFAIDNDDLGATTAEGQIVEENVQFGPSAPLVVGLPSWVGGQSTLMYVAGGAIAAYLVYHYWSDMSES